MKITVRLTGAATLARLDVDRLVQRLTADLERQPQTEAEARPPRRLG